MQPKVKKGSCKQVIQIWEKPQRKQIQYPNRNHDQLDIFKQSSLNPQKFLRDTMDVNDINKKHKSNFYHDYFIGNKLREKDYQFKQQKPFMERQNQTLDVKDINCQKKFTFQWKRQTNPVSPNYHHDFLQSQIKENILQIIPNEKVVHEKQSSAQNLKSFLNVKDINQFQNYSFKSKRSTDPVNPNYQYNIQQSRMIDCPFATSFNDQPKNTNPPSRASLSNNTQQNIELPLINNYKDINSNKSQI